LRRKKSAAAAQKTTPGKGRLGCTQAYADLMAKACASGLDISSADGYIAAIAAANGLTVATRDTGPFVAAGVAVINPWQI
jgi:toxin FitB